MKKVLSLVLTLALVLSSFSMAFADDAATATAEPTPAGKAGMNLSDVAKSPNKEAIGVVNDLGIVLGTPEGTFLPEKDVTRAEFAAMITRALAIPKSALEGYQQTPFKDMAGYEWANGYIAFCVSKGIMVGDGMGNAMPGRTVTLNEAVTMALRAIGYVDNSSHLKGAWPANFVTKAQELGLYDKVAKDSVVANRETAAQLIYNLLVEQKVAVDTDGQTRYLFKSYDKNGNGEGEINLLNSGLNADGEYTIITAEKLDNSAINLAKYVGQSGTLYTSRQTKKNVAFMPEKDFVLLVGRLTKDKDFVTTDDETTYRLKEPQYGPAKDDIPVPTLLNNGSDKENKESALKDLDKNSGELAVFAEVSGKTIKEVSVINKWTVTKDKQVEAGDLSNFKNAKLLGFKFAKDDNGDIDTKQFQLVGANTLEDIKADNIVYVYTAKNSSSEPIVKVEVGTETVEGVVKRFENGDLDSGTVDTFKIGDKTFKNAKDVQAGVGDATSVAKGDVTAEIKAVLDARGFVYDFTSKNKADKYALLLKKTGAADLEDRAKLVLADGTEKIVSFDLEAQELAKFNAVTSGGANGLVAYGLNKDGVLTEVDKELSVKSIAAGQAQFRSNTVLYDTTDSTYYTIDKDVVVFKYDKATPTTANVKFEVTTMDKVTKQEKTEKASQEVKILINDKKKVFAILVGGADAKSGEKKFAVVNKMTPVESNGSNVLEFDGFIDGVEGKKYTDDKSSDLESFDTVYDNAGVNSEVNLYEVTLNKDGVITGAEEVYPMSGSVAFDHGNINTVEKHSTVFGEVTKSNGRKSARVTGGVELAFSEKVVMYKVVKGGSYELFAGSPQKDDFVKAYEVDGSLGYDVVFVVTPGEYSNITGTNLVQVTGNGATGKNNKIILQNNVNDRFVIKDVDEGKFYALAANGDMEATKYDTATDAAKDTNQLANLNTVVAAVNGKKYAVIKVEDAVVTATITPTDGNVINGDSSGGDKKVFKDGKNQVVIKIAGTKVKSNNNVTFGDVLTVGTLANVTNGNMLLVIKAENDTITVVASNNGSDFTAFDENFTVAIKKELLADPEYDGGETVKVLSAAATYAESANKQVNVKAN